MLVVITYDVNTETSVVPHEGTWIEITTQLHKILTMPVVPHEGTWIEIAGFSTVIPPL